jgi:hypothetical protein
MDIFLQERVPTQPDNVWQKLKIDRTNGLLGNDNCPGDIVEERVYAVYPPEARQWAIDHNIPQPPTDKSPNCPIPADPGAIKARLDVATPREGNQLSGVSDIRGTVVMPNFDHYLVQIGFGSDPTDWIQIAYGTNMVQDASLTTWDTRRFGDGQYSIRVAMYDRSGTFVAGRVRVRVSNTPVATVPRGTSTRTPTTTQTKPLASPSATPTTVLAFTPTLTKSLTPTLTASPTSTQFAPTATTLPPTATRTSTPTTGLSTNTPTNTSAPTTTPSPTRTPTTATP